MKIYIVIVIAAFSFVSCNVAKSQKSISKEEVAVILKENPEILLDALREKRIELFEIAEKGAIEKQKNEIEAKRKAEIEKPKVPVIEDGRIIRGNKSAPITIVEYSDFECPYCAKGAWTVKAVMQKYGDKVRFVYKHNPLPFHKQALPASKYFEAIGKQSPEEAWKFHDMIFQNQGLLKMGDAGFQNIIASLKIDKSKLSKDLSAESVAETIKSDMAEAKKFGFGGTPTFLINGITLTGAQPEKNFSELIDFIIANP